MKPLVLAFAGLLLVTSTAATSQLTSPVFLPGDRTLGPAADTQEQPAIAAGSGGSLVVWSDARDALGDLAAYWGGPYLTPGVGTMRDIYATRLDPSGNLIDLTPIPVTMETLNQGMPRVSWNGENWLVVWQHQGGPACCPNSEIRAARVSPAGTVLDATPILVASVSGQNVEWPAVASDGANWLVVWRGWDMAAGIATLNGTRVSPTGNVLDGTGVVMRHDSWNSYPTNADVTFAAAEYLLTWLEGSGGLDNHYVVRGQRFTPALAKLDANPFTINLYAPTNAKNPRVATNGTDFFVAWFEDRYVGWAQAFGSRVSHAGQVLDPAGIAISAVAGYSQFAPVVAWSGTNWVVAYNQHAPDTFDENIYATRVSTAGKVLDATARVIKAGAGAQNEPAIATVPGGARVVWKDARAGGVTPDDVYSSSITSQGVVGTDACVALGAPRQRGARIAWDGANYLAVFVSEISGTARIVGQRFDATGVALDANPFILASGPSLGTPSVAWDGTRYLVVWSDVLQETIYGRRVGPDGVALDPVATLMPGRGSDVAALGDAFLVVGTYAPNPHFRQPYAVRVRGADGVRLDATPILVGGYFATTASVAPIGDRWLVSFQLNESHDNPRADVWANFVSQNGVAGTEFAVAATAVPSEQDPFVVSDGNTAMVLWTDGADITGRRVQADGSLLDPSGILISTAPGTQVDPAAAWDGSQFVTAFADFRNDPPLGQPVGDVYGVRVNAQAMVLDPDGFALANSPAVPELEPTVGAGGPRPVLGAAVFCPEAPFAAYRLGLRFLNPSAPVGVGETPTSSRGIAVSPNPSRGTMELSFVIGREAWTTVRVYDAMGRVVRELYAGSAPAGTLHVSWNGRDAQDNMVSAGAYFVRISSDAQVRMAKVIRER